MKAKCVHCSKVFNDDDHLVAHIQAQHAEDYTPTQQQLDDAARQAIWQFLKSDGKDVGLLAKAKQANGYRSTEVKREQTESATNATLAMACREYAEDKKEFRELIRKALPNLPMFKGLPSGNA